VLFFETESDRDASINRIANITNYRNSVANSQVIYIKVNNKNNNECQGIGDFLIEVNPLPDFSVEGEAPEEPQLLCLNDISLNLEVENPLANDYSYSWQDENGNDLGIGNNIDVFSKGNYTVTATINATGCSRSRTITVEESDLVTLDNSFVTINDNLINSQTNNLSVFIDVTKIGLVIEDFLYAIATEDGTIIQDYQDSPLFENLQGGIYKVLIENKDGCGNSESLISVIEIPKYFSPNNDGKNDFWNVKGVDQTFYSTADIKIFDRFGKLINITTVNDLGWDGTFNGASLPEDDYWYTINLIPTDTSKKAFQKTGHFSLIKKN
jgi:gliding motility-associated-like protein